jgi:hypothetical protein
MGRHRLAISVKAQEKAIPTGPLRVKDFFETLSRITNQEAPLLIFEVLVIDGPRPYSNHLFFLTELTTIIILLFSYV